MQQVLSLSNLKRERCDHFSLTIMIGSSKQWRGDLQAITGRFGAATSNPRVKALIPCEKEELDTDALDKIKDKEERHI